MRKTYRASDVKDYWQKRWDAIPADTAMSNTDKYPLKYAIQTIGSDKNGKILEAGCGAGRILRYYHNLQFRISGFDYIETAISKLKEADASLDVSTQDICSLSYEDESFKYILAFGLYHNLENGLDKAISETHRVLLRGGRVCASFRADNIQNRINDYLSDRNSKLPRSHQTNFHKLNLTSQEFKRIFTRNGFKIISFSPVENMPLLYKFRLFRSQNHKVFNESLGRVQGYRLSLFGTIIQNLLMTFFPSQFCNIYVVIAEKLDE